jgi:hypothetical protein
MEVEIKNSIIYNNPNIKYLAITMYGISMNKITNIKERNQVKSS